MRLEGDLRSVKFDDKGLVPAVVQNEDGEVLMLAYMNEASLQKTLETGYAWYFSRSRQKLWQKGETSGHVQKVRSIFYDCDGDTLLVRVSQTGVACHTGSYSCFTDRLLAAENCEQSAPDEAGIEPSADILRDLYAVIANRRRHPVEGSYTNYLFDKGHDKILKKVGEEAVETVIASKGGSLNDIIYEMGDLWYHCLVLMCYHDISVEDILEELSRRHQGGKYHKFTGKTGVRPQD